MQKYLQLNDLSSYKKAFYLSNYVWSIVLQWEWFAKKGIGLQFVSAVDSCSANIAEGFGRYGKKDKIKFYFYSFGSIKESMDWNEKARVRNLVSKAQHEHILTELQALSLEVYQLIKFTNDKLKE